MVVGLALSSGVGGWAAGATQTIRIYAEVLPRTRLVVDASGIGRPDVGKGMASSVTATGGASGAIVRVYARSRSAVSLSIKADSSLGVGGYPGMAAMVASAAPGSHLVIGCAIQGSRVASWSAPDGPAWGLSYLVAGIPADPHWSVAQTITYTLTVP
jgi:hypothetical protein